MKYLEQITKLISEEFIKKEVMSEIVTSDYYPKQFQVFLDKYKYNFRMITEKDRFFVSFQDYKSDVLDKSLYSGDKAIHSDPVGLYCYPFDYVVNHPMDITFAFGSRYLLVIERVTDNYVNLQELTKSEFFSYAYKLYPDFDERNEFFLENNTFNIHDGVNIHWGKYLFFIIQHHIFSKKEKDLEDENRFGFSVLRYSSIDNRDEQRKRALKMGIKCLVDSPEQKKESVINTNEPEQCVFFSRDAFKILEVFNLSSSPEHGLKPYKITRKLSGIVARNIKGKVNIKQSYKSPNAYSVDIGDNFSMEVFFDEEWKSSELRKKKDTGRLFIKEIVVYGNGSRFSFKPSETESVEEIGNSIYDRYTGMIQRVNRESIESFFNVKAIKGIANIIGISAINFKGLSFEDKQKIYDIILKIDSFSAEYMNKAIENNDFDSFRYWFVVTSENYYTDRKQNKKYIKVIDNIIKFVWEVTQWEKKQGFKFNYRFYGNHYSLFQDMYFHLKYMIKEREKEREKELVKSESFLNYFDHSNHLKNKIKSFNLKEEKEMLEKLNKLLNEVNECLSPEEQQEFRRLSREYHRYDEYGESMSPEDEQRYKELLAKKRHSQEKDEDKSTLLRMTGKHGQHWTDDPKHYEYDKEHFPNG
ncbi:MAG: hypothetical protein QXG00_08465 [Candidatus Woesearchaeota archaeon]